MSIVYLTGIPGVGKTSVTQAIKSIDSRIEIIRYSDVLKSYYKTVYNQEYTTQQLREGSSKIISAEDIKCLDNHVVQMIKRSKAEHIIIESHAVTVEEFGYRATPFSKHILTATNPDSIVVLYADPVLLQQRISMNPQGRREQTINDIVYEQNIQAMLALAYSFFIGAKTYFIDTNNCVDYVAKLILEKVIE